VREIRVAGGGGFDDLADPPDRDAEELEVALEVALLAVGALRGSERAQLLLQFGGDLASCETHRRRMLFASRIRRERRAKAQQAAFVT
jgi:hypothetical protein